MVGLVEVKKIMWRLEFFVFFLRGSFGVEVGFAKRVDVFFV
jgi:hypothetical protein